MILKNHFDSSPADRGTWDVGVTKGKGGKAQVYGEGKGNIYTSKNGKWRVDAGGRWDAGRGRKPGYGGGISVSGRWRREAAEPNGIEGINLQNEKLGLEEINLETEQGQGEEAQLNDDYEQNRSVRDVRPLIFRPVRPITPRPIPRPKPRPWPRV